MKRLAFALSLLALSRMAAADPPEDAEGVLKRLGDADGLLDALKSLEPANLDADECAKVIRGLPGLVEKAGEAKSHVTGVLEKLNDREADPVFLPALVEVYDKLEPVPGARHAALEIVAHIKGDAAAHAFLGLLQRPSSRDVEPLAVVDFKNEEGETRRMRFFKFAGKAKPEKWYVGASGSYLPDDADVEDDGSTFSEFEELDSKSLEEHVKKYVGEDIVTITKSK